MKRQKTGKQEVRCWWGRVKVIEEHLPRRQHRQQRALRPQLRRRRKRSVVSCLMLLSCIKKSKGTDEKQAKEKGKKVRCWDSGRVIERHFHSQMQMRVRVPVPLPPQRGTGRRWFVVGCG